MLLKKTVVICQTHPTQFDIPLFRFLDGDPEIDLCVYFTRWTSDDLPVDPEVGQRPIWQVAPYSGYSANRRGPGVGGLFQMLISIGRRKCDLLIVSGYSNLTYVLIILVGMATKKMLGLRSDSILDIPKRRGWKMAAKRVLLPALFRIAFSTGHPTGTLAAKYLRYYGMKQESLFPLPYNVDGEFLRSRCESTQPEQKRLRATMQIRSTDFVVLGVAKFVDREDPLTLIEAFEGLGKLTSSAHLVLVGDGVLRERMERLVLKNGLRNVHLPGYIPYFDLPMYYGIASVFVHAAINESWGVSVNEALACGVPVIAANSVGAHVDLIREGINGHVFPTGDSAALCSLLIGLYREPERHRRMTLVARESIASWSYLQTRNHITSALNYVSNLGQDPK